MTLKFSRNPRTIDNKMPIDTLETRKIVSKSVMFWMLWLKIMKILVISDQDPRIKQEVMVKVEGRID